MLKIWPWRICIKKKKFMYLMEATINPWRLARNRRGQAKKQRSECKSERKLEVILKWLTGRQKPTNEEQASHPQVKHITTRGLRGSKTLKTSGEDKTFKIKQEMCKKLTIQRTNSKSSRSDQEQRNLSATHQKLEKYLNGFQKKDLNCPFLHGSKAESC